MVINLSNSSYLLWVQFLGCLRLNFVIIVVSVPDSFMGFAGHGTLTEFANL
jgi:hypothetical protein